MQEKPAQVVAARPSTAATSSRQDRRQAADRPGEAERNVLAKLLGLENAKQFGLKVNGPGRWWLPLRP
jgi:hypothetical protein